MQYIFLRYPGGKAKAVTLSYDDGVLSDLRFADVISEAGLKCTFNFSASVSCSEEQVKEKILDRGHEVAVHCAHHRALGLKSTASGIKEVLDCRVALEKKHNRIIRGMAYPDSGIRNFVTGMTYEKIKNYLTELNMAYARTLGSDNNEFKLPEDWHAWMPTAHHNNPEILNYIDEFVNLEISSAVYPARRYPRLFYMWGHSYEFDRDNNWEHLDVICEKLGGKDDIWYATNMEIYEYVEAYNSLVYSADETIVYNPTLFDIWLETTGNIICIKSGETKSLYADESKS